MDLSTIKVNTAADILWQYRGTPVAQLLEYHNLSVPNRRHTDADLLIGMCMDHRLKLRIPSNFAFVLRCAGANLGMLEFDVSFAIAVGGVRSICLIGHEGCRMVDVASKREAFVSGLVEVVGWERHRAEEHFDANCSRYGFGDIASFVWLEAERLRRVYEGIIVAPLLYSLDDRSLCQISDSRPSIATASEAVEAEGGRERR